MRIEEVEGLAQEINEAKEVWIVIDAADQAIEALRAEAWYPIEKAEELGAKDGRDVLVYTGRIAELVTWREDEDGDWDWYTDAGFHLTGDPSIPTHFRFINPPVLN